MRETYTHGHHDSVLRSHRWRTAENSAAYLLSELRPDMSLLDVGCGPGTITADFARALSSGSVIGIDASADVLAEANAEAAGLPNVRFQTGDLYQLAFEDETFDVVHAHQVLQHLGDPAGALLEMHRVVRAGGIVAVRDADFGGFFWSPGDERLERWRTLYREVAKRNGADCETARRLPELVRAAGFNDLQVTGSLWVFADEESRAWWGSSWGDRTEQSAFASQAIEYDLSTVSELAELAGAWRDWMGEANGVFGVPNIEVLARR